MEITSIAVVKNKRQLYAFMKDSTVVVRRLIYLQLTADSRKGCLITAEISTRYSLFVMSPYLLPLWIFGNLISKLLNCCYRVQTARLLVFFIKISNFSRNRGKLLNASLGLEESRILGLLKVHLSTEVPSS